MNFVRMKAIGIGAAAVPFAAGTFETGERGVVRSSELWGGVFWACLGVFVAWSGRDLGLGRVNDPGSGFALFWLGVIMVALSGAIILAAFRDPGAPLTQLWADTRWGKILLVVTLLVVYGVFFESIGFVPASVALLLILMTFVDPVRPLVALPVAILAPLAVYHLVTKWLKIQMPAGLMADGLQWFGWR
jgi:putative tricarboxylic transport membrane protein